MIKIINLPPILDATFNTHNNLKQNVLNSPWTRLLFIEWIIFLVTIKLFSSYAAIEAKEIKNLKNQILLLKFLLERILKFAEQNEIRFYSKAIITQ
jgi:hypothetical protein